MMKSTDGQGGRMDKNMVGLGLRKKGRRLCQPIIVRFSVQQFHRIKNVVKMFSELKIVQRI